MKSKIHEVLNLNNVKLSKNLKLIFGAFILLCAFQASAQVSVNVNIGARPDWCDHYEDDVEYFYLPEIEAYYDTHASVFIYLGPRGWIRSAYLPNYCHDYDLYHGYKYAIDYHGRAPYAFHRNHRAKYFHSNYRNYRQEYYNPGPNRRYVASNRTHHTYYDKRDFKRDKHDDHRGNGNRNDRGNDHGNGRGNGNGHGNGRK